MKKEIEYNGKVFTKSSFSPYGGKCVGVSITENKVFVINTLTKKAEVEFTHDEWKAFLLGVKNNEFEINE